jgi:hypothetical protein
MSNGNAATDNPTPSANVYPRDGGSSLGVAASGNSLVTTAAGSGANSTADVPATATGGVLGQPLTWWGGLIVLFIVLGMVAKRAGNESEFGNLKVSAYNIVMITIAAIIGIAGFKVLFTRFQVPGISALVLAV